MELTVRQIVEKEFRKAWKGYSRDQVDEFLDRVIHDLEGVLKGHSESALTPAEIRQKRFARGWFGYHPGEVDAFMTQVALAMEAAARSQSPPRPPARQDETHGRLVWVADDWSVRVAIERGAILLTTESGSIALQPGTARQMAEALLQCSKELKQAADEKSQ